MRILEIGFGKSGQSLHHALCQFEFGKGFDPSVDLQGSYSQQFAHYVRSRVADDTSIALVAAADNMVTGYLLGSLGEGSRNPGAKLESMFVKPEYRRKGIGHQLVAAFLEWAWAHGALRVTVSVAPGNSAAVELYRKLGFGDQTLVLEAHPAQMGEDR